MMNIKKQCFVLALILLSTSLFSQEKYWVFLTDKNSTSFNPKSYFDQKALDRRIRNGISIDDISDYPLNQDYTTSKEG